MLKVRDPADVRSVVAGVTATTAAEVTVACDRAPGLRSYARIKTAAARFVW